MSFDATKIVVATFNGNLNGNFVIGTCPTKPHISIQKLSEQAKTPYENYPAGYRLFSAHNYVIEPNSKLVIDTDIRLSNNTYYVGAVTSQDFSIKTFLVAPNGRVDMRIKVYNNTNQRLDIEKHKCVAELRLLDVVAGLKIIDF